jgi:o-succinylbenzoate synthase
MRIVHATLSPFRLRLRGTLATAHARMHERDGVLVELHDDEGRVGTGEATPIEGFGNETRATALLALQRLARVAVGDRGSTLEVRLAALERAEPDAPFARFAVETALLDLVAQARGVSLAALLTRAGEKPRDAVPVNALIASDDPRDAAREARRAVRAGFGTLKLKVARGSLDDDVARVGAVRAAVGDAVQLRLDANGGWTREAALRALDALAVFAPELVEQPVPADTLDALSFVRARSPIPVAADESLVDAARARRVLELGAADWLVLKPGALGGLYASLALADRARDAGVGVIVTSGLDGAVGRAAALALAAALPDAPSACGLATGALLAGDLARGPRPLLGQLAIPGGSGLGVRVTRRTLERHRDAPVIRIRGEDG